MRDIGRIPAERSTTYEILRRFGKEEDEHYDPLDRLDPAAEDALFGSHQQLIMSETFRFARGRRVTATQR